MRFTLVLLPFLGVHCAGTRARITLMPRCWSGSVKPGTPFTGSTGRLVTCASNLGPIAKELVVFVIASLAFCAVAIMSHKLDPLDPLDLFETQLVLYPQT
jgi:hypothetical protein